MKGDGFVPIDPRILDTGTIKNIYPYTNPFSPYSDIYKIKQFDSSTPLVIDKYYGLLYNEAILNGGAIYGESSQFPKVKFDDQSDLGFLRVPFKRIPRIFIKEQDQFDNVITQIQCAHPHHQLFYRGQTREHLLQRSETCLFNLYGDSTAKEPSLVSSSSREQVEVNKYMVKWCGLIHMALANFVKSKSTSRLSIDDYVYWSRSYVFARYALAIAQHYGLPSNGLDLTTDPKIAATFAFNEFAPEQWPNARYFPKKDWSNLSVIYVYAIKDTGLVINFNKSVPKMLPHSRPSFQEAFFLYSGWGYKLNESARNIVAALYFDRSDLINTVQIASLFPNINLDEFGASLFSLLERHKQYDQNIEFLLKRFYWINAD